MHTAFLEHTNLNTKTPGGGLLTMEKLRLVSRACRPVQGGSVQGISYVQGLQSSSRAREFKSALYRPDYDTPDSLDTHMWLQTPERIRPVQTASSEWDLSYTIRAIHGALRNHSIGSGSCNCRIRIQPFEKPKAKSIPKRITSGIKRRSSKKLQLINAKPEHSGQHLKQLLPAYNAARTILQHSTFITSYAQQLIAKCIDSSAEASGPRLSRRLRSA